MCNSNFKRSTAELISEAIKIERESADVQRLKAIEKELNKRKKTLKGDGDTFSYNSKLFDFILESTFSKSGTKTECNFDLLKALSSEIYAQVVTVKVTPPRHYLKAIDKKTGKKVW